MALDHGWAFVPVKGQAKNRIALRNRVYFSIRWLEDNGYLSSRALVRVRQYGDGVVVCRKDTPYKGIVVQGPNGVTVDLPPIVGSKLAPATKKPNK